MDPDVADILLKGVTTREFFIFYLIGLSGVIIRFLINLYVGIKTDPNTPNRFRFVYFIKGLIRLVISFGLLALFIAQFPEFSHDLVDMQPVFSDPTRLAEGVTVEVEAKITAKLAFGIGLGIDEIIKRIVSGGYKVINKKLE